MHTAIWGVYPLGQLAQAIEPANDSSLWSQADGIATTPESVLVLQTYAVDNPSGGDPHVVHNFLGVNTNNGDVGAFMGQQPANAQDDIASTPQGALILAQLDGNDNPPKGFRLSHVSNQGAFVSLGIWGTDFEDDPGRISVGEDGAVWVAGSTRGTLDGSWNACALRLDSLDPGAVVRRISWIRGDVRSLVWTPRVCGRREALVRVAPQPQPRPRRNEVASAGTRISRWNGASWPWMAENAAVGLERAVAWHLPAGTVEIGSSTHRVALPLIVVD